MPTSVLRSNDSHRYHRIYIYMVETREIGIQTDPESVPPTSPPRGTGTQTVQSTSPPRETGTQRDPVIIRPTSPDAPLPAAPSTSHADTPLDSRQDILWTPSPVPWKISLAMAVPYPRRKALPVDPVPPVSWNPVARKAQAGGCLEHTEAAGGDREAAGKGVFCTRPG